MFDRILVPLDGTAFAEHALVPARDLARVFGSRITLVRAVGPSGLPVAAPERQAALERLDDADAYLHGVRDDLRAAGLDASVALYIAAPGAAVAEAAEVSHSDLIVMAAHPRWRADLLDDASTTLRVLAQTRVALLAWRATLAIAAGSGQGMTGQERAFLGRAESPILVPLDGSAFAEEALPTAEALAGRFGTFVMLVRAVQDPEEAPPFADAVSDYELDEAAAYLGRVRADLARRGVGTAVVARRGNPVRVIDRVWRECDAGLVVMASHGTSGPGRGFFGSVAAHAIEDLDAPILVVRPAATGDGWCSGA
jgi:nucleotide-binding universal stress UspA family protein